MKNEKINGVYNKNLELKKEIRHKQETSDKLQDYMISYILANGNVVVFKDDQTYTLYVKEITARKLNKKTLSLKTGYTQAELDLLGIVELVERKAVTFKEVADMYEDEIRQVLKERKATDDEFKKLF